MDDTKQLIDQLIAEHKTISKRNEALEKSANDASLLSNLKEARDTFVSGGPSRHENLKTLAKTLEEINTWLEKHFNREETVLLPAVEKSGNEKLLAALNSLLFEHSDLRDRMLHSRKRVDELLSDGLPQSVWDARASDMRIYISHTRKLLETHAARENHLFTEVRRYLKQGSQRKEKK